MVSGTNKWADVHNLVLHDHKAEVDKLLGHHFSSSGLWLAVKRVWICLMMNLCETWQMLWLGLLLRPCKWVLLDKNTIKLFYFSFIQYCLISWLHGHMKGKTRLYIYDSLFSFNSAKFRQCINWYIYGAKQGIYNTFHIIGAFLRGVPAAVIDCRAIGVDKVKLVRSWNQLLMVVCIMCIWPGRYYAAMDLCYPSPTLWIFQQEKKCPNIYWGRGGGILKIPFQQLL